MDDQALMTAWKNSVANNAGRPWNISGISPAEIRAELKDIRQTLNWTDDRAGIKHRLFNARIRLDKLQATSSQGGWNDLEELFAKVQETAVRRLGDELAVE